MYVIAIPRSPLAVVTKVTLTLFVCLAGFLIAAPSAQAATHVTAPSVTSLAVDAGTAITGPVQPMTTSASYLATAGTQALDLQRFPITLVHPRYVIVAATLVDGAYLFSYRLTVAHAGEMVTAITVATNEQQHTELLEVGTPTPATMAFAKQARQPLATSPAQPSIPTTTVASSEIGPLHSARAVSPLVSPGQSATSHFTTTWWDPVGIVLADVHTTESCTVGSDDVSLSSCSGYDYRYWFAPDGWAEYYHYTVSFMSPSYPFGPLTSGDEQTWSGYQNSIFCAFQTNQIHYRPNDAYVALNSGYLFTGGSVTTWDSGGCNNLVHYASVFQ